MADTNHIQATVERVTPAATLDDLAGAVDAIALLGEAYRGLRAEWERRVLEYIEANGEFVLRHGDAEVRYYAGIDKRTKCRNAAETLEALLAACEGDLGLLAQCLASEPFKHGSIRTLLADKGHPETWGKLFAVEERPVLKEGKPQKQLQQTNMKYLRGAQQR